MQTGGTILLQIGGRDKQAVKSHSPLFEFSPYDINSVEKQWHKL